MHWLSLSISHVYAYLSSCVGIPDDLCVAENAHFCKCEVLIEKNSLKLVLKFQQRTPKLCMSVFPVSVCTEVSHSLKYPSTCVHSVFAHD